MVLENDVDAELALLRRLRARRSEKENAYESPATKLRSSSATTASTRSSSTAATRSPLALATPPPLSTLASARLAARARATASAEKTPRLALPPSVNTQRASPAPASRLIVPTRTSTTATATSSLPHRLPRPESRRASPPLEPQVEPSPPKALAVPQPTLQTPQAAPPLSSKPQVPPPNKPAPLLQVPERIFECVLDDDGNVTTRCFRKGKFLGKGGFARCYEMTCEETGIKYAGKIVAKSSLIKPKAKQKFTSEIKIHKALRHRHVVQFEHFFDDADHSYILLELCRNQSLSDLLRRRKRISEAEVRFYITQLVDGIEYLHQNLVIHRDLKLGNLFLTSDMEIKIGDFGLATRLDTQYDRKRTMCGTPNYIAPEILTGQRGDGHSFEVDIWSTGVIMYTLLVGKPPFETEDVKDTYKRIRANDFAFPIDSDVSDAAQSLIRMILRREPHLRPSLRAMRAHPFMRDAYVPSTLPRAALLITPPDCKRQAMTHAASATTTTAAPLALPLAPRRHPLRSRDVNVQSSASGHSNNEVPPATASMDQNVVANANATPLAKLDMRRDRATATVTSVAPPQRSSSTRTTESPAASSLAFQRSTERQTALEQQPQQQHDPLETMCATLSRLFALEETHVRDMQLTEFSSATSVVAAAQRLKEIDASTAAAIAPPTLWVAKCVDYSSKYGLGYILSNGAAGVYFNDSTKAIAAPNNAWFEYMDRVPASDDDEVETLEHRVRIAAGTHDASLAKKVTLLQHFRSYLLDSEKEIDLLAPHLISSNRTDPDAPMEFVCKWVTTRHAMLLCLSNETFQINFKDASRLLLTNGGSIATFLDKDGALVVVPTARVVLQNERPDLLKRLRYARDMLQQMLRIGSSSTSAQRSSSEKNKDKEGD